MSHKRAVYSDLEKQVFLDILKKYKHIIESRATNSSTIKEKSEAWSLITEEYNKSILVSTQRDMSQIKKYWSNLKHINKNILTTEKQSRYLTGGGPEINLPQVVAQVLEILPVLNATAPFIGSSNLNEQESEELHQDIILAVQSGEKRKIDNMSNNNVYLQTHEPSCLFERQIISHRI
ncbi:myb/SANT-like DNA-binding domain-containing protein 3 isoform X1 [Prorops nasuta]|uniref:myb/SANT-like DNA-binding domain-containing protein 3 isoform X1 n=1 Tax=Prorops nasuta TaxID=863751 RepID=UPI0034CF7732